MVKQSQVSPPVLTEVQFGTAYNLPYHIDSTHIEHVSVVNIIYIYILSCIINACLQQQQESAVIKLNEEEDWSVLAETDDESCQCHGCCKLDPVLEIPTHGDKVPCNSYQTASLVYY